jgi:hypothetical protein
VLDTLLAEISDPLLLQHWTVLFVIVLLIAVTAG